MTQNGPEVVFCEREATALVTVDPESADMGLGTWDA